MPPIKMPLGLWPLSWPLVSSQQLYICTSSPARLLYPPRQMCLCPGSSGRSQKTYIQRPMVLTRRSWKARIFSRSSTHWSYHQLVSYSPTICCRVPLHPSLGTACEICGRTYWGLCALARVLLDLSPLLRGNGDSGSLLILKLNRQHIRIELYWMV